LYAYPFTTTSVRKVKQPHTVFCKGKREKDMIEIIVKTSTAVFIVDFLWLHETEAVLV
jgi:hypothetical protein